MSLFLILQYQIYNIDLYVHCYNFSTYMEDHCLYDEESLINNSNKNIKSPNIWPPSPAAPSLMRTHSLYLSVAAEEGDHCNSNHEFTGME